MLKQRTASSSVKFGYAADVWLRDADIEDSTRDGYAGYLTRIIKPAVGEVALNKLGARELESLYAELRRCRTRCDGKPFIVHNKPGDRDCATSECHPP